MTIFQSGFAEKLNAALDWREASGYKRDTHLRSFVKFDAFCVEHFPEETELKRDVVYSWLDNITESVKNINHPAEFIRQFGKYLAAINEPAYILPEKIAANKPSFVPYNFTDGELTALFAEIDKLPNETDEPFLNDIAAVIFRLIYTCGLRPNEGRELLAENVNLDTGEILITRTKLNRERFVVMFDDMLEFSRLYDLKRRIICGNNPYFFPSRRSGGAFTARKLLALLNKAWMAASCTSQNPIPRRIRVYDLRHRFASARLNRWLDERENLYVMLPFLSAYMGHKTLSETAYYIHILPENLLKSPAIDWNKFNMMFPEPASQRQREVPEE
jgi:integrase